MKKRELLIIAGFLVAAVLAYQFTASAPEPSAPRRSVSSVVNSLRREVVGDAASATVNRSGTIPVLVGVKELRVTGVSELTISGDTRENIAYSLDADSRAPTEREAKIQANGVELRQDDLGDVLALSIRVPGEGRTTSRLVLKVPARLAVRLSSQGPMKAQLAGLAGAQLDVVGDTRLTGVRAVAGSHRNGSLVIDGGGAVTLFLQGSEATLTRVRGPIALTARGGRSRVEASTGTLIVEATNHEAVAVADHDGTVRIGGTAGAVRVERPQQDVSIDVRRARVDVEIDRPVSLTALTSDAPLTVLVRDLRAMAIDAAVTDGRVDAADFGMTSVTRNNESELIQRVDRPAGRMTLRNRHSVIVLRKAK